MGLLVEQFTVEYDARQQPTVDPTKLMVPDGSATLTVEVRPEQREQLVALLEQAPGLEILPGHRRASAGWLVAVAAGGATADVERAADSLRPHTGRE